MFKVNPQVKVHLQQNGQVLVYKDRLPCQKGNFRPFSTPKELFLTTKIYTVSSISRFQHSDIEKQAVSISYSFNSAL